MTAYTGNDGLTYDITGTKVTVTGTGVSATSMSSGVLTLADSTTIDLKPNITEVDLSGCPNVTALRDWMCAGMLQLTKFDFPPSLTSISNGLLYNTGFRDVIIPAAITSISQYGICHMPNLENIIFMGNKPTTLGTYSVAKMEGTTGTTVYANVYSNGWASDSVFIPEIRGLAEYTYVPYVPITADYMRHGSKEIVVLAAKQDINGRELTDLLDSSVIAPATYPIASDANKVPSAAYIANYVSRGISNYAATGVFYASNTAGNLRGDFVAVAKINGNSIIKAQNTAWGIDLMKPDLSNADIATAQAGKFLKVASDGTIEYDTPSGTVSVTDHSTYITLNY